VLSAAVRTQRSRYDACHRPIRLTVGHFHRRSAADHGYWWQVCSPLLVLVLVVVTFQQVGDAQNDIVSRQRLAGFRAWVLAECPVAPARRTLAPAPREARVRGDQDVPILFLGDRTPPSSRLDPPSSRRPDQRPPGTRSFGATVTSTALVFAKGTAVTAEDVHNAQAM
jgi:hypothetical protein